MACITGETDAFGLAWCRVEAGSFAAGAALIYLVEATLLPCK